MCLRDDALHVTNPNTQRARNFANTCPVSPHSPYLCGARTGRCGGIETLLMQIEINPLCMEFAKERDQVL
jgi:hypothetical protein